MKVAEGRGDVQGDSGDATVIWWRTHRLIYDYRHSGEDRSTATDRPAPLHSAPPLLHYVNVDVERLERCHRCACRCDWSARDTLRREASRHRTTTQASRSRSAQQLSRTHRVSVTTASTVRATATCHSSSHSRLHLHPHFFVRSIRSCYISELIVDSTA